MRSRVCLIVDDDPNIRKFVRAILEREQFAVWEADGGDPALAKVRELGAIDLIITDIQMPDGDGPTLAAAVREMYPSLPIILISGYSKPDGRFEFLEKPFTGEGLARVVRRLIEGKAA